MDYIVTIMVSLTNIRWLGEHKLSKMNKISTIKCYQPKRGISDDALMVGKLNINVNTT